MNHPTSSSRLKYSKRLTAAGAASAAAILTLGSASAAVSIVNVDTLLHPWSGNSYFSFSPTGSSFTPSFDNSYTAGIRNCGFNLMNFSTTNFQWTSALLTPGTVVGSSQSFSSNFNVFTPYPAEGAKAYAGYRLTNQGPGNDETHYGYVQVTGGPDDSFTVDYYSYESSPNTSITVVPEVSSFLLGAAGVGTLALRRRRSVKG